MTKFILSFLLTLYFFQLGCASGSVGEVFTDEQVNAVRIGMTRLQVEGIIGKPFTMNRDQDKNVYYTYMFTLSSRPGRMEMVSIYFDSNNRVEDVLKNISMDPK